VFYCLPPTFPLILIVARETGQADMDLLLIELPSYIDVGRRSKIPFGTYLNEFIGPKHTSATFHFFLQLPAELQLNILELCDARTTFKLMQTCSSIRKVATKLFWSQKDLWFYIAAEDLAISDEKQKPDSIYWNSEFVSRIEQVEIECGLNTMGPNTRILGSTTQPPVAADAERYRTVFQRAFPSAKRIVISDTKPYRDPQYGLLEDLTIFARALSTQYTVFGSLVSRQIRLRHPQPRDLYRLDSASQWTLVQKAWVRECVLPPTEKISGIVGMFVKFCWRDKLVGRDCTALRYLRNELYEKYHFGGPKQISFVCPRSGCDIEFKSAAEWRDHITTSDPHSNPDHLVGVGTEGTPGYISALPADIENALLAKELEVQKAMKEVSDMKRVLKKIWGEEHSEQRRLYKEQFLAQLKDDPLCKCQHETPENSAIFHDLTRRWDHIDWSRELRRTQKRNGMEET
jgi:hypothetical protein